MVMYMAKKTYKKSSSKKTSKKVSKHRSKNLELLGVGAKKEVKSMIRQAMDVAVEDKYKLDTEYNSKTGTWDDNTKTLAFNITPNIPTGTGIGQRLGNKVRLKYLRMFIRYLPAIHQHNEDISGDNPVNTTLNWFPVVPDAVCSLVRVTPDLKNNITDAQFREAVRCKVRPPGYAWQDFAQSVGNDSINGIKILDRFKLKARYKHMVCPFAPIAQSIAAVGAGYASTPTYDPVVTVVNCPQYTYKNFYCAKVSQKIEIDDESNSPIKYQYWMFIDIDNDFNDDTYNPINVPKTFDTRQLWVYEDA